MTGGRFALAAVLLLVLCSRLPLLPEGYGSDPDAWRVAATARHLLETGEYRVSRFPGYPLHELISAPLVAAGGAPLSNAATICAMLALLIVWSRLVEDRSRHPLILILALAFAPLYWKNSVVTMDYLWSILCMLGAWHAALRGKDLAAGVLLGLTIGFRPPNLVAAVPIATALLLATPSLRILFRFAVASAVTGFVVLLPPLVTYGPLGWLEATRSAAREFSFGPGERVLLFGYRSVYALGPLAVITAVAACVRGRSDLFREITRRSPLILSAAAGVAAFGLLYLLYPLEREYLLPVFPFLFVLIDRAADRRLMIFFLLALASFAFVNPDVVRHEGVRGRPEFNVRWGVLAQEMDLRQRQAVRRAELAALDLPGPAVIMTGSGPEFWVENSAFEADPDSFWRFSPEVIVRQARNPDLHFIDGLTRDQIGPVRSRGYVIYCYGRSREYLELLLGYSMNTEGIPVVGPPGLETQ